MASEAIQSSWAWSRIWLHRRVECREPELDVVREPLVLNLGGAVVLRLELEVGCEAAGVLAELGVCGAMVLQWSVGDGGVCTVCNEGGLVYSRCNIGM